MGGILSPRVFEISFLRRDRAIPTGYQQFFPHPLDRPCNSGRSELVLPPMWYARDPTANAPVPAAAGSEQNLSEVFDNIYRFGIWGRDEIGEATSGYGSHEKRVIEPYVKLSRILLTKLGRSTVVDIGCGDFNVGRHLAGKCALYIACDVSQFILDRNSERFAAENLKFMHLDLATSDLPRGDIAMVRQVLQHLSNAAIKAFVDRINDTKPYRYLLLTEHVPKSEFIPNADFEPGHDIRIAVDSGVVLHEAPFNLVHKSRRLMFDVPADAYGREAVIRTILYEF